MMRCVVIDYGSGNVRSVIRGLKNVSTKYQQVTLTDCHNQITTADQIVLPGVGSFANCYHALYNKPGLIESIKQFLLKERPFLGICVGMQLFADHGFEYGNNPGLGLISGKVKPFSKALISNMPIPHIGWTTIRISSDAVNHPVLLGCHQKMMYFIHSYIFVAKHDKHVLAISNYGQSFTATIGRDNIIGTQFHPEKSQHSGMHLLNNFLHWKP